VLEPCGQGLRWVERVQREVKPVGDVEQTDKTLVAWVCPSTLSQKGGSVLTV